MLNLDRELLELASLSFPKRGVNPLSIQEIINTQYDQILTERIRFLNNPNNADRDHDLRVSIRTLRGLFNFLKKEIPASSFETIDTNLLVRLKQLIPIFLRQL